MKVKEKPRTAMDLKLGQIKHTLANLKTIMQELDVKIPVLALGIDVHINLVGRWSRGESQPGLQNAINLVNALLKKGYEPPPSGGPTLSSMLDFVAELPTTTAAAKALGVSTQDINNWQRGKTLPSLRMLYRMDEALND